MFDILPLLSDFGFAHLLTVPAIRACLLSALWQPPQCWRLKVACLNISEHQEWPTEFASKISTSYLKPAIGLFSYKLKPIIQGTAPVEFHRLSNSA